MAAVRNKNTKPELIVRKALHGAGFRYRLHDSTLPGKPDIVLPKHKAVIFVHGCFWHGHQCDQFKWPMSREEFWRNKITNNATVDAAATAALRQRGWRVGLIWECAIRGKNKVAIPIILQRLEAWLSSNSPVFELCSN